MSIASKVVVYTAIFGGKDDYAEPPKGDYEAVLFTDSLTEGRLKAQRARVVGFHYFGGSGEPAVIAAKAFKVNPMLYVQGDYSLWIDGSVVMKPVNVQEMIGKYLSNGVDMAAFSHPSRSCAYEEAKTCIELNLDDPGKINRQMARYASEGYPQRHGLFACGVLLRRHTEETMNFSEAWWDEILEGSRRDQLSFPYVVWKTGTKIAVIPGTMESQGFTVRPHLR